MSVRNTTLRALVTISVAVFAAAAGAQKWTPFGPVDYQKDLQPFKTFEIRNFTGSPDVQDGYFFSFDKLSWGFSGERVVVGSPTAVFTSPNIYPGFGFTPEELESLPDDIRENAVELPRLPNNILDGFPDGSFGWGDRYEFGYVVDHHGWLVSIIDGPDDNDDLNLGFGDAIPWGSVAILFDAPAGYFDGFIDLIVDGQGGVSRVDANGDGIPDGDGLFADDIDADLVHGPDGIDTSVPPDFIPDVPFPTDFDDLVTLIPTFSTVTMRNFTDLQGVELMKTYRFKPSHRGDVVEFYYGARYFRLQDTFRIDTTGGFIGASFWDTRVRNNVVGPQVGMKWFRRQGRWTLNAQGRFMFGYNVEDMSQQGEIGGNIVPSAHNSPLFFQPHAFKHGRQDQDFSPLAEMRVEATYHLTRAVAFKLGYTATFVDNIRRAALHVRYRLPNMGLVDAGTQDIFVSGANLGFEIRN